MITFALNLLAVAFFLTGSIKSQQASVGSCQISQDFSEMVGFLNCWGLFRVTVLRKTVTCSADPRAKSQHRQISTQRIRQNVGFLPGDFQKNQHRTHMNRPAPLQAAPASRKKTAGPGACRSGADPVSCAKLSGRDLQFFSVTVNADGLARLLCRL